LGIKRTQIFAPQRGARAWDPLALAEEAREEQLHRDFGWPGYGARS
jgi:hypothetical protein